MITHPLADEAATQRLGAAIAPMLQRGDAVCLWGPLGAGKSTLARALIRSLTTPHEEVPSPTFTLVQTYQAAFPIAHFDLYRLRTAEEAFELGIEEALDEGAVLIEWPERLSGRLPSNRLDIEIEMDGEARIARLHPRGDFEGRKLELERDRQIAAFLEDTGFGDAARQVLAGDASTRRFLRLIRDGKAPLILMDAPLVEEAAAPDPDATPTQRMGAGYNAMARLSASRTDAFVAASQFLRGRGFSAPEVLAYNTELGLAVVEDLGDGLFATLITKGEPEEPLYLTAVEALAELHSETPPLWIGEDAVRWPLLPYDNLALRTGADLMVEWLPKLKPEVVIDNAGTAAWDGLWRPFRARAEQGASAFTHRDYHAENLLWLPERRGVARVGMVDFQDCVLAHPSWDLHSLLQDARRDVSPALEAKALSHYFSLRPDVDASAFMDDYTALAALNQARIIGIFSRLIVRDGKPRYASFLPRMWRHLEANLRHPAMAGLKAWFDAYVPARVRG